MYKPSQHYHCINLLDNLVFSTNYTSFPSKQFSYSTSMVIKDTHNKVIFMGVCFAARPVVEEGTEAFMANDGITKICYLVATTHGV